MTRPTEPGGPDGRDAADRAARFDRSDVEYGSRAWQTPADSRTMQALVSRCWRADWPAMHLHAGDVDWWSVHALARSPALDGRIRLWFEGEPDATELVAFAWYGPPIDADLIVAPDHRTAELIGSMVDWVDAQVARFGGTPAGRVAGLDVDGVESTGADVATTAAARIWTVATDAGLVRALRAMGLEEGSEPGYLHHCAPIGALDLTVPALQPGYELRTIRTDADVAGRVATGHAAFPGSTMTVEKYQFCRTTPLYRPALDTILVAPDGTVAAFALGWLDPLTGGIELEPVGVHPDHQRRGLGRAVCRATLRTGASLGAEQVVIAAEAANPAANGLYAALGLPVEARIIAYRRPTPG
jgi:ribosomal protein S18 acetylase RimI-like enzyme